MSELIRELLFRLTMVAIGTAVGVVVFLSVYLLTSNVEWAWWAAVGAMAAVCVIGVVVERRLR